MKNAIQNIQMPQFVVAYNEITDEEVVEVTEGDDNAKNVRES